MQNTSAIDMEVRDKQEEELQAEATEFKELLDSEYDYQEPARGELRKGTIMQITANEVILDVGGKRDGVVPVSDLAKLEDDLVESLQIGDEIAVVVQHPRSESGELLLSIHQAQQEQDWEEAQQLLEREEILELPVTSYNKGGITVGFGGLRGFIPNSHLLTVHREQRPDESQTAKRNMLDQKIRTLILEVDRQRRRLVMSQRLAERRWQMQRKNQLIEDLEVGDIVTGTVTALRNFGAFVDVGGADGLIHLSELAWGRISHPREVLDVGQEVRVSVLRLDKERGRIGLSLRRAQPNPWESIHERYYPGQVVDVTVTNLVDFGAFARLEPGVEGLIHVSELSHQPVSHPREVVRPGLEVTVEVLRVEAEEERIGLSLKRAPQWVVEEEPFQEEVDEAAQSEAEEQDAVPEAAAEVDDTEVEGEAETDGSGSDVEVVPEPVEAEAGVAVATEAQEEEPASADQAVDVEAMAADASREKDNDAEASAVRASEAEAEEDITAEKETV